MLISLVPSVREVVAAGAGFVVGAFTPAVGRKIKSFFVKESTVVKSDEGSEVKAVEKKL